MSSLAVSRLPDPNDRDFFRLFDAVRHEPWKVREMIAEEPALVEATRVIGETVIHWFIVENDIKSVRLLYDSGAPVDSYALTEACALGHVQMCDLLLCLGVRPNIESCAIQLKLGAPSRRVRTRMLAVFRHHGYPLVERR